MDKSNAFTDESPEEKLYLLNFKGMYYMSNANFKECLEMYVQLIYEIEHWDGKNILKSNDYFIGLNNLLILQVMNKKFDHYNETLTKIHDQFDGLGAYKALLFNITLCYEIGIYCEIGEAKKGLQIIPEIEKGLNNYGSETNEINKLLFYLNIAIIYFYNSNYSKAIYWLNIFLNDYSIKKNDVSSNIYYYGHIINMIIQFEAKNYEAIDYLYNECMNNLKKIRKIGLFDQLILDFIKNKSDHPFMSRTKKFESFTDLKMKLNEIIKSQEETISLQFFDFFAWIDSHLKKAPIHELIKKKIQNNNQQ